MIIVSQKIFQKLLPAYYGITLWPFIIMRHTLREMGGRRFAVLINHERIHIRQQLETLLVFFYILYGVFYVINRIKGQTHSAAYCNIPFERESYANEADISYLKSRPWLSWRKYI